MLDEPAGLLPSPPHVLGPVWRTHENGSWWLPEHSLGWEMLNWYADNLLQPDGPRAGEMWLPTMEQARFIVWWYAVDIYGKFVYRNGLLRRMKGWGKDPLIAAMALGEMAGPTRFSHWENGVPIGKVASMPWVQIAAVTEDQTFNTFSLFEPMVSGKMKTAYGVVCHKTYVEAKKTNGRIQANTKNPLALEGKRPTFVVKNETQWWLENNFGHAMSNVIQGNVDKSAYGQCRALAICNAHVPGQESDAEQEYDNYQKVLSGDAIDTGFLYDSIEAPADTPALEIADLVEDPPAFEQAMNKLRQGLEIARGDSIWMDIETLVNSIINKKNKATESRRKFLNQVNAAEDAWLSPVEWDSNSDPALRLRAGDSITLGFDGSKGDDWTALVACRIADGALFLIHSWNPAKHGGEIPRELVNSRVEWAFNRFSVVGMRADVKEFESYVDQWGATYGKKMKIKATPQHPIAFDMRSNVKKFTLDCEKFEDAVLEGELSHDGNKAMRSHVLHAHAKPNNHGVSIGKATKDSSRKIDIAVCAVLAFGMRQEFLMSKDNRNRGVTVIR